MVEQDAVELSLISDAELPEDLLSENKVVDVIEDLDELMEGQIPGKPAYMAFCDFVEFQRARSYWLQALGLVEGTIDNHDELSKAEKKTNLRQSEIRRGLIEERIATAESRVPGYLEAYSTISNTLFSLEVAIGNEKSDSYEGSYEDAGIEAWDIYEDFYTYLKSDDRQKGLTFAQSTARTESMFSPLNVEDLSNGE